LASAYGDMPPLVSTENERKKFSDEMEKIKDKEQFHKTVETVETMETG
jgi:hypothetical protein